MKVKILSSRYKAEPCNAFGEGSAFNLDESQNLLQLTQLAHFPRRVL